MKALSLRDACGIVVLIAVLFILAWNYQFFPFGRGQAEVEVTITPTVEFVPAQIQTFDEDVSDPVPLLTLDEQVAAVLRKREEQLAERDRKYKEAMLWHN